MAFSRNGLLEKWNRGDQTFIHCDHRPLKGFILTMLNLIDDKFLEDSKIQLKLLIKVKEFYC